MKAAAARDCFGGVESKSFFQNPGVRAVTKYLREDDPAMERYLYKLAAHAEVRVLSGLSIPEEMAAIVVILSEYAPFQLVLSMSEQFRSVACSWLEEHCKNISKTT